MRTVFLNPDTWDLVIDRSGNIAVAADPYSQAQDAASAIKTFQGECYFNTALGIPYWQRVLGKFPPAALMKSYFVRAALTVPGVLKARCFLASVENRTVRGQVQITNSAGLPSYLGF
jgi:hypothetical protein